MVTLALAIQQPPHQALIRLESESKERRTKVTPNGEEWLFCITITLAFVSVSELCSVKVVLNLIFFHPPHSLFFSS